MHDWHSIKISDCFERLKASRRGLSQEQREKRLGKYGKNQLPQPRGLGAGRIFLSQFRNALIYVLLFTGALSVVIRSYKEAAVIFGAVAINVLIGFIQENKANRAIHKLRTLVEHKAYVLRDGAETALDSALVVPGDIILLRAGSRIPADARVIEAHELLIDEAALTGESMPVDKRPDPVPRSAVLADRSDMAYAGTVVLNGSGRALVVRTGQDTEIGMIAGLVEAAEEERTPLQEKLARFSRFLGMVFGFVCLLIIAAGLYQGRSVKEMVETGVALGVASIPEGLVVAVTFILALGMQRILKEKALTRKLIAAETLGSTTVILSDKTGTLTEGNMSVAHVIVGGNEYQLSGQGRRHEQEDERIISLALRIGLLCNDAIIENPHDELSAWRFLGNPTETALLKAGIESGLDREAILQKAPLIAKLPFNSEQKFMITLHQSGPSGALLYEKGAPEVLLEKCTRFYHQGRPEPLGPADLSRLKAEYEGLTRRGLRVIGTAEREFSRQRGLDPGNADNIDWKELDQELVFAGFIALKDPLRPEAAGMVRLAAQAGVRTIMITGDHKLTAKAIAQEIGLKTKVENILDGEDLDKASDEELRRLVGKTTVYARVSPRHKLRVVMALKEQGEVVAMTGDGINDSPALKAADIGISLGSGTDVAKETADVILLDNNFKTIVSAIKQGRVIFKNIRKVITYLISDSFSEITLIIGSIIFNTPLAILPAQILWINIVNDSLPHFSLAFEQDHGEVMTEKPIDRQASIIDRRMKIIIFGAGIFRDILLFGLFYYLLARWGHLPGKTEYLTTLVFITLGLKSLFSIFSLRSFGRQIWSYGPFSNRYLVAAVLSSLSLLAASVYWPPLRGLLGNAAGVGPEAWLIAFLFAGFNVILLEAVKAAFIIKRKLART